MKRNYTTGQEDSIVFFTGVEIEHTPAYGKSTLFVVGIQSTQEIQDWLDDVASYKDRIDHIFFGANHSYDPNCHQVHAEWEQMITCFLDKGYLCSLDIPMNQVEEFNENSLNEYDNFIPQIRVVIPYVKLWNYNTMIKIDDKDFKSTNPGVWSHSLHKLKDRLNFTSWDQYNNDKVLK